MRFHQHVINVNYCNAIMQCMSYELVMNHSNSHLSKTMKFSSGLRQTTLFHPFLCNKGTEILAKLKQCYCKDF